MAYITEKQQEILFEAAEVLAQKKAAERFTKNYQRQLAEICVKAHEAGLSDRQISLGLDQQLSRVRIQQLRASVSE